MIITLYIMEHFRVCDDILTAFGFPNAGYILPYLIIFFKKFSSSKFAPSQLTMLPHPVGTERVLSPPIIRNRGKPVASPPNPNTTPFLIQPTAVSPDCVSVPSLFTKSPQDCNKRLYTWLHIEFQRYSGSKRLIYNVAI